jgi:methyl-accepting chemotaxis protein
VALLDSLGSLGQSLLGQLEERLLKFLAPVLNPAIHLFNEAKTFLERLTTLLDRVHTLVQDTQDAYSKIRHFSLKPHWKNRVISVPRVVENIQNLLAIPDQVISAVKDLVNNIRSSVPDSTQAAADAEDIANAAAEAEDLSKFVGKFSGKFGPKLAKGFEKSVGIFAIAFDALTKISATVDDLQSVIDAINALVDDLNNLDGIFLPQKNPRRTEALRSGGSIKIRVGNLHT